MKQAEEGRQEWEQTLASERLVRESAEIQVFNPFSGFFHRNFAKKFGRI